MDWQSSDVVYRINPVTRVIAALVFVGYFIAVVVGYFATPRPDQFPWGLVIVGAVVVTLAYNYLTRWRLCVTEQGLTRHRYLFGEDHWPWEDFTSGKIDKIYPMKLRDRKRPLWRRTINLQALADCDAPTVMQAVNWHYKPAELELPDELQFKYGIGWVVTLTKQGIRLRVRTKLREYRWADVKRIRVFRQDPVRQDFFNLDIILPDEQIKLYVLIVDNRLNPSWRGAKAEEINQYLRQYVPSERWREQVEGDEITEAEDLEAELEKCREGIRVCWAFCSISAVGTAAAMAWAAKDGPVFESKLVIVGMISFPICVWLLIAEKLKYNKIRRALEDAGQAEQPNALRV